MRLSYVGICDEQSSPGIFRKIKGVVNGAAENGIDSDAILVKPGQWTKFVISCFRAISLNSNGIVMIRYAPNYAMFFIVFCLYAKIRNVRLIIDVPTPIINHLKEIYISSRSALFKSIYLTLVIVMNCLPFIFASKIVSYAPDSRFFIPKFKDNLLIGNGVNISEWNTEFVVSNDNVIRIICVGAIAPWHGWDKLLYSIARIESKFERPVELTICGDGPGLYDLKEIVESRNLQSTIVFEGNLEYKALSAAYARADIAIGSLAWERVSVAYASPIKSREYLANGLPVVYKTYDPDLSSKCPYAFEVRSDEELDNTLLMLLKEVPFSKQDIHDWAAVNLDFSIKVKQILL